MSKQNKETKILIGSVAALLLIAVLVFMLSRDGSGPTGAETIFAQGFWYLFTMAVFFAVAVAAVIAGVVIYRKTQETGKLAVPAIIAVVALSLAFGKGCTDKANHGVTSPAGRIESKK